MRYKIGFLGGGRIARIILGGLTRVGESLDEIIVSDANTQVRETLQGQYPPIHITAENCDAVRAEFVFLALHPPQLIPTIKEVRNSIPPEAIVVSLAPKVTLQDIAAAFGDFERVARSIPNAPSLVNAGFNPVCFSEACSESDQNKVVALLRKLGDCPVVEEQTLEAYAVISAMGPTYFWFQWQAMEELATTFGLTGDDARSAISQMVTGAVKTLFESTLSADEVMDLVPVRPLEENEAEIGNIFRERLDAIYKKLTS